MYAKPKIIIVDGLSGAGKSTFAGYLGEHLNCPVIHGDEFLFDSVLAKREEMERIFGHLPLEGESGLEYLIRCDRHEEVGRHRDFFATARDYIEKRFEEKVKHLITTQAPEFVVFEWLTANQLNKLWLNADYRIMINSEPDGRTRRLNENMYKIGKERVDIQRVRELAHGPCLVNASNINTVVYNQYDSFLKQHVKTISSTLRRIL